MVSGVQGLVAADNVTQMPSYCERRGEMQNVRHFVEALPYGAGQE